MAFQLDTFALFAAAGIQERYWASLENLSQASFETLKAEDLVETCNVDGKSMPLPVARGIIRKLRNATCHASQKPDPLVEVLERVKVQARFQPAIVELCVGSIERLGKIEFDELSKRYDSNGVLIPLPVAKGIVRKLHDYIAAKKLDAALIISNAWQTEEIDRKHATELQRREDFLQKMRACDEAERLRQEREKIERLQKEAEEEKRRMQQEEQQRKRAEAAERRFAEDGFGDTLVCMLGLVGTCSSQCQPSCTRGRHHSGLVEMPDENEVLVRITEAKMKLLQSKWADAGGYGELQGAWQVRNRRLQRLFQATEHNLRLELGHISDTIDAWHGTGEQNILSIAQTGFDTGLRAGQAYGAGEYFAKDPNVSIGYAEGGSFLLLCKLALGKDGKHHSWVDAMKYYIVKQQSGYVQAVPLYVVQFKAARSVLARHLVEVNQHEEEDDGVLKDRQRGARHPCTARAHARIKGNAAERLWLGWLAPELTQASDHDVFLDVCQFLDGVDVAEVIPERNGARIGAFVRLGTPIDRQTFAEVTSRRYRGQYRISVDDHPPGYVATRVCPRLIGQSKYCRSWNIRGHHKWNWGCPFQHPPEIRPTHVAEYALETVSVGTAKYDEIETAFSLSAPFHNGHPRLVAVHRVVNRVLEAMYEKRRAFLADKHGFALEKDLWHGTNCKAFAELLTHGLQPPSDTCASDDCPVSGGNGLSTTLCSTSCPHCTEPHVWNRCHMYGSGVYLADVASKSHRYVQEPVQAAWIRGRAGSLWGFVVAEDKDAWQLDSGRLARKDAEGTEWIWDAGGHAADGHAAVHKMIFCRVCLGSPYLIEGNLRRPDAMHDICWCQDPRPYLETTVQEWNQAKGHDAFYVRGLAGAHSPGLGVYNSEYIVFHPYQILPLYIVDYVLE